MNALCLFFATVWIVLGLFFVLTVVVFLLTAVSFSFFIRCLFFVVVII